MVLAFSYLASLTRPSCMKRILPVIIVSQFFCTSVWFAGNAVIGDLARSLQLSPAYLGYLSNAVQAGFITGTLIFALLGLNDKFSPSKLFFTCALIAAGINLMVSSAWITPFSLIGCRVVTGFFLAGIYPVGMKIAADHYQQGLGRSLGYLVGALVLGTAFPHLAKSLSAGLPWKYVLYTTSALCALGGSAMLLLVPDGPYRTIGQKLDLSYALTAFKDPQFRSAALGYAGHMWELYTFWVFVPVMVGAYVAHYPASGLNIPLTSFGVIAAGSLACVLGGHLSQRWGAQRVATAALFTSCICCLLSPLFLFSGSPTVFLMFLVIWSMAVIADSPLFSTLVAQHAPAAYKGTSLTMVTCIGFAVTLVSVQLLSALHNDHNARYIFTLLAIGPILGLLALRKARPSDKA